MLSVTFAANRDQRSLLILTIGEIAAKFGGISIEPFIKFHRPRTCLGFSAAKTPEIFADLYGGFAIATLTPCFAVPGAEDAKEEAEIRSRRRVPIDGEAYFEQETRSWRRRF